MVECCYCGNEILCYIEDEEFLDQILRENFVHAAKGCLCQKRTQPPTSVSKIMYCPQ